MNHVTGGSFLALIAVASAVGSPTAVGGAGREAANPTRVPAPHPLATARTTPRFFLEALPSPAGGAPALLLHARSYEGAIRPAGVDLSLPSGEGSSARAGLRFLGGRTDAAPTAAVRLPGRSHFLHGNDRSKWTRNVPQYAEAVQDGLYPGVDLRWHGTDGRLEFDLRVAPGVDVASASFTLEGMTGARVAADGGILAGAAGGEFLLSKPLAWQETGAGRVPVEVAYVAAADGSFRFRAGPHDATRALVIDPILDFHSNVSWGVGANYCFGVGLAGDGSSFYTGYTDVTTFVATPGAFDETHSPDYYEATAGKLDSDGNVVWVTYLGGSSGEWGDDVAVDGNGVPTVYGTTSSSNFPTRDPLRGTLVGTEYFVTRLTADGSDLVWSTYLGGSGIEGGAYNPDAMAMDSAGNVYVAGKTTSTDFPIVGGFQASAGGTGDAFVAKIAADGQSILFSSYLGGSLVDEATGLALAPDGDVVVAGRTMSLDFPLVGAFASYATPGQSFGWVARVASDGASLVYSTYLGGSVDWVESVAVDGDGAAFVCGETSAASFVTTTGSFQPSFGGIQDAFLVKIAPDGSAREWSTYFGGSGYDRGYAVAVDSEGYAYLGGFADTRFTDFPLRNSLAESSPSGNGFLAKFSLDGTGILFSTSVAGTQVNDIEVDGLGTCVLSNFGDAVRIQFHLPSPPSGLLADAGTSSIALTWTDASADEESFEIQRRTGEEAFATLASAAPDATGYEDATAEPGATYTYRVRAVNGAGASGWSEQAEGALPPTLDMSARNGSLSNVVGLGRDRLRVAGDFGFSDASPDGHMNPSAESVSVRVGPPADPLVLDIPARDAAWRVRAGRYTWKSPRDASPRWAVTLDTRRGRFQVAVDRFDFSPAPTGAVSVILTVGDDSGWDAKQWSPTRNGKFQYKNK